MTVIEVVLLILGALIFAASFIIPEKLSGKDPERESGMGSAVGGIDAREMVETMKEDIERQVRLAVDTSAEVAVEDAVLRSERSIERVTNEKMMAIDEYAQTVMQDINKNHKEVVFLYDMLENKTIDIKNTVRKAENTRDEIEDTGKKVRTELENIARKSAETVIANSDRRHAEQNTVQRPVAEPAPAPGQMAEPVSAPAPAVPEEPYYEAGPVPEPAPLPAVSAIPAEAPAEPVSEPVPEISPEEVDSSMKEKGVPKLGRAAAAAFAQAAAIAEASAAAEKAEEAAPVPQVTPVQQSAPIPQVTPVQQSAPVPQAAPIPQPVPVRQAAPMPDSAYNQEPQYEPAYDAGNREDAMAALYNVPAGVMNVQDDNLHFVDPSLNEPASNAEEEGGEVTFSNNDDLNGLVISMHRTGISDVEIAKRLSIGVGEVRLMIELYGK